jgi:iron complex outermembrane receptor protein
MNNLRFTQSLAIGLLSTICHLPTYATDGVLLTAKELLDLSIEELMQIEVVTIATGSQQTTREAPAITTVITAAEITASGAQDLSQVLETVPGLHVIKTSFGNWPFYVIRGLFSVPNPEVLLMVNNIPLKDLQYGNRGLSNWEWPLHNIARIEVIRGPGSAIYGADAFAGVINIITKTQAEMEDGETGLRLGSFNTKEIWALQGGQWAGFEVSAALQYLKSDGHQPLIEEDIQTLYDQQFGTHASLAPGKANLDREFLGMQLELAQANWRWRSGYEKRDHIGMGVSNALDSLGDLSSHFFHTELIYHQAQLTPNWEVTGQLSQQNLVNRGIYYLFPPGAFGGAYPQGMIANQGSSETHTRLDAYGFYTGFKQHRCRLGIGYEYANLYKVVESRNFGLAPTTGLQLPPGSPVVDASDTAVVGLPERNRQVCGATL